MKLGGNHAVSQHSILHSLIVVPAEAMHGSGSGAQRFGPTSATHRRRLMPFANVGGRSGVFCAGLRPLWMELAAPLAPPRFHEHVR